MDKARKYDFKSSVRTPEMDEILKVASDFTDPDAGKTSPNIKETLSQNAKVAPKMGSEMSSMREKMRKLAREVAEEENSSAEAIAENSETKTDNTDKCDMSTASIVESPAKQDKTTEKKVPEKKEQSTDKKSGSSKKKN